MLRLRDLKNELKELRNLNRRCVSNKLNSKYKKLFAQLPPLEEKVMNFCFVSGDSYRTCGYKLSYCERQVKRIVSKSIELINQIINKEGEQ